MKQIVYKIIYVILIIALIVTVALLIKKELNSRENEDLNKQVLAEFNNSVNTVNIQNVKLHGYDVIGKVYIPKINIESSVTIFIESLIFLIHEKNLIKSLLISF